MVGVLLQVIPHARKRSPDGDVLFRALSLAPQYCVSPARQFRGCAALEVGVVQARGEGFSRDYRRRLWVSRINVELGLRRALPGTNRIFVVPAATLGVPFVRPVFRYEVSQLGEQLRLYQAPPMSLGAKIALAYNF